MRRPRTGVRSGLFAGILVLALLLTEMPASADARNLTLRWRWGAQGPAVCEIVAFVARYPEWRNGRRYVRVYGRFVGCDKPRTMGSGDGTLSVSGKGPNGKWYGGATGWCPDTCRMRAWIPYTGKGTYHGLVYYRDQGYLIERGHDPQLRPYGWVSPR